MSESRTISVPMTKWFPPNDPLAMQIARVSVLREYYLLEQRGTTLDDLGKLDSHSVLWRKLYFIVNTMRTVSEIHGALHVINGNPEFKQIRAYQGGQENALLDKILSAFDRDMVTVKAIRQSLGGHVSQTSMQNALNAVSPTVVGEMVIGPTRGETHLKFVEKLVLEVLMPGMSEEQRGQTFHGYMELLNRIFPVIDLIEKITVWYVLHRELAAVKPGEPANQ
jgi:hypothetical protein